MIFLGSSVLTSHWLLCITCFTSFVSFTDVYSDYVSKGEKNVANVFPTPPITPPPPARSCGNSQPEPSMDNRSIGQGRDFTLTLTDKCSTVQPLYNGHVEDKRVAISRGSTALL